MKILVSGGAGFIGSHLCEYLLKKGHSVSCMDNLITGSLNNIKHLLTNKKFEFINHDITKYISIKSDLDYVMHLASPASPIDYQKMPIQTLKVGSLGTHNTLGLALAKKSRFLLASTSEVYGDPLVNPQPENYWGSVNPVGIRGCYDEAKRFAEAITMAYKRVHNLETRIARIFNTYGERMRLNDGRVVPNFISQALQNKPLTVYGTGMQTRSFCYISDMIDGLYRLAISDISEPINLGNPDEKTILEFANIIIGITKSKSKIIYEKLPDDDPKTRRPEIAKARRLLNWVPKIKLEDGLNRTIEYFRNMMR